MSRSAHAKLSASGADRWMGCPGSVYASRGFPDSGDTIYTAEGSAAHDVAERCLRNNRDANYYFGQTVKRGPFTFTVNREMVGAIQEYLNRVRVWQVALPQAELLIEHTVYLPDSIGQSMYGTLDAAVIEPFGFGVIIDFKYGKGIAVDGQGNKQLRYYGLGAYLEFDLAKVRVELVQPRARHFDGPIRGEDLNSTDLDQWADEMAAAVTEVNMGPKADMRAGSHCKWCPLKPTCPVAKKQAQKIAGMIFAAEPADVCTPNEGQHLANILKWRPWLIDWLNSVVNRAHANMVKDVAVPGWKLVRNAGARKWADARAEDAAFDWLESLEGIELQDLFPSKAVSPKGAEDLLVSIGRKKDKKKLAAWWSSGAGSVTIAPLNDPRPAAKPVTAADVFGEDEPW